MRIKYIKLENFLGIYAGMNRTSIEIDFKNNKNKIIILNAANGKGKSTLLSMLHPLRQTYDSRKDIVIPNELGHKIVDLTHEGNEYYIEHFYGKKNKSFISKNGKELNENGNIKSFNEIAKEELGIDSDYFKIGRIGSNVSNFIDLNSTDRKKYITEFIPSIDEYLEAFDTIKEKYTEYNSQIKFIKNTIEKYSGTKELSDIKANVKILTNQLSDFEKKLIKVKTKIESFSSMKKKLEDEIVSYINNETQYHCGNFKENINEVTLYLDNDLTEIENTRNYWQEEENNFIEKYKIRKTGDIYQYILELDNKFLARKTNYEEALDNLEKELNKLQNQKINIQNKIEYYKTKLEEYNISYTPEQIDDFKHQLEIFDKELTINNKKLTTAESKFTNKRLEEIFDFYKDILNTSDPCTLTSTMTDIINGYDSIKESYDLSILTEYYQNKKSNNTVDPKSISKSIKLKEKELEETNKTLNLIEGRLKLANETLPKRSAKCTDDTCSFIKHTIEVQKNDPPEQERQLKKKETLEKELKELEETRAKYEQFVEISKSLKYYDNYVTKTFPSFISSEIISREILITNNSTLLDDLDIPTIESIFTLKKLIDSISDNKNKLQNLIDTYSISESLITEYTTQLEDYENQLKENETLIEENIATKDDTILKLNDAKARIEICKEYYEIYKELNESSNLYEELLKHQKKLFELLTNYKKFKTDNNIDELAESEQMLERNIDSIKTKIEEESTAVKIIEDNMKKLSEIEAIYNDIVLIKDALDPKKGIPTVFANEYLKSIATKTNKLLKVAYEDQFKIRFNITASDFLVEVYKGDGTMLKDINLASQGETSLTNISLSLAMLEHMIKKYNIVYLDEVDSMLSTENRKLFIELLENQIDNLNIEQCFVITHNNEFYDKNIDLILLEGHDCDLDDKDFMAGKNVIFKL